MSHTDAPETLIACPRCDALAAAAPIKAGRSLSCPRCGVTLIAPERGAGLRILLLAAASLALIAGAVTLPFLSVRRFGLGNETTLAGVLDRVTGPGYALALLVVALAIGLPAVRMALTVYVLTPVVARRAPWPGAARAFRWAEALRPWSMAEVFALGAGVALFKLSDMAHVTLGPAFWMFAVLVVLLVAQDRLLCRWSLWEALGR